MGLTDMMRRSRSDQSTGDHHFAPLELQTAVTATEDESPRGDNRSRKQKEEVLTAAGGEITLDPEMAQKCAIVRESDGNFIFYVHQAHATNAQVISVKKRAELQLGIAGSDKTMALVACSPSDLRDLYGTQAAEAAGAVNGEMRERVEDFFRKAARQKINDVQMSLRRDTARAAFQVESYLTRPILELDPEEASQFTTVAFYMADDGATVEQPTIDQDFSITDPKKLPEGVDCIRGQTAVLADGRHLNMRFVYTDSVVAEGGLEGLGLTKQHLEDLYRVMEAPYGQVTVAGPTESGKSTFLNIFTIAYSEAHDHAIVALGIDDTQESISEHILPMLVPEHKFGEEDPFAAKIHTSLRLAPHLIKVGECRTGMTANATADAAYTGKVALTTLHTPSIFSIPRRFIRLGLPHDVAYDYSLHLCWVALRLVPTLCPDCRIPITNLPDDLPGRRRLIVDDFAKITAHTPGTYYIRGAGCPTCNNNMRKRTGLMGRRLCAEIVRPTRTFCEILERDSGEARRHVIVDMERSTIRLDAFRHVQAGLIGLDTYTNYIAQAHELAEDLALLKERPVRSDKILRAVDG